MDCCSKELPIEHPENVGEVSSTDPENAPAPEDDPKRGCTSCGQASRPVKRKTMLLMLKPDRFDRIGDGKYRFCSDPACRVLYFTVGEGADFTTADLRVRVGVKEKENSTPLCYCFGFDQADIREEIASRGRTTIPQRIASLLKEGMCACPSKNPSGACCLVEVIKTVRRLYGARSEQANEVMS